MAESYFLSVEHAGGGAHKTLHRRTESSAIKVATSFLIREAGAFKAGHCCISVLPHHDVLGYVIRHRDNGPVVWEEEEEE